MTGSLEVEKVQWFRRAYFTFLEDVDRAAFFADQDAQRAAQIEEMGVEVKAFVNGKKRLADFRYWFRIAAQEEGWSNLLDEDGTNSLEVLITDMTDWSSLENALRKAVAVPEDLESAKSAMLEFENFIEAWARREKASKSRLDDGRVPFVLSCLWHFQEPDSWPIFFRSIRDRFNRLGMSYSGYLIDQYFDFVDWCREIEDEIGIDLYTLEHVCALANENYLEVPELEEAYDRRIAAAKQHDILGEADAAIDEYEKALALVPDDIASLRRCGELWEGKKQWALARAEYEEILRQRPDDKAAALRLKIFDQKLKRKESAD